MAVSLAVGFLASRKVSAGDKNSDISHLPVLKDGKVLRVCSELRYERRLAAVSSAILTAIGNYEPVFSHFPENEEASMPIWVLDIGANNGDWSCHFACKFENLNFLAVDPNPLLSQIIPCNYSNIEVHNYAMSDQEGAIEFRPEDGKAFVGKLEAKQKSSGNVPVVTMDAFFAAQKSRLPRYMHLDVEGYELSLLKGGLATLDSLPILTYEVHMNSSLAQECTEFLENRGYKMFMINEICGVRHDCRNMLAIPKIDLESYLNHEAFKWIHLTDLAVMIDAGQLQSTYQKYAYKAFPWQG